MSYAILDLVMLAVAAVAAAVALPRRPDLVGPILLTIVVLLVLTAVFDSVMIGAGLMVYSDAGRSGIELGVAPIEDFAYPLAGALLLPSVWVLLGGRKGDGRGE